MKEIITLQVGPFANFVGSHLWNLKDEAAGHEDSVSLGSTDVCLTWSNRGSSLQEPVLVPRLVLIDFKGALGPVSMTPEAEQRAHEHPHPGFSTWQGQAAVHQAPPVQRSRFLDLLQVEEEEEEEDKSHPDALQAAPTSRSASRSTAQEPQIRSATDSRGGNVPRQDERNRDREREEQERAAGIDLESSSRSSNYWTQYLKSYLHPRSVVLTQGGWWQGSGVGEALKPFWEAPQVVEKETMEEVEDRVRLFAEECDHMQGFNMIANSYDVFANVASRTLQSLADDYPKVPRVLFSVRPPEAVLREWMPEDPSQTSGPAASRAEGALRQSAMVAVSSALALGGALGHSDLCVPLQRRSVSGLLPYAHPKDNSLFHSSALYAAAIQALLLPCSLSRPLTGSQGCGLDVGDLVGLLRGSAHNSPLAASLALPCTAAPTGAQGAPITAGAACLSWEPSPPPEEGTSFAGGGGGAQLAVLQGAMAADSDVAAPTSTARAALEKALTAEQRLLGRPILTHIALSPSPLWVPLPFPRFFSDRIGVNGAILGTVARASGGPALRGSDRVGPDVRSVPVLARLERKVEACSLVEESLNTLRSRSGRSDVTLSGIRKVIKGADVEESLLDELTEILEMARKGS